MRWSVGDASVSSDARLHEDLEECVARRLDQYQEPSVATWTWMLLTGTFIAMVLFALLH
jgi:hypothetical protein